MAFKLLYLIQYFFNKFIVNMTRKLLIYLAKYNQYHFTMLCFFMFFSQTTKATTYYVNDNSTKGDVYTTTIGNDANDGLTPNSPKLTLISVYKKAKVGDVIYVDFGNYTDISSNGQLLFENQKKIHIIIANQKEAVTAKNALPANDKVSPEIFYIVDDKPVERDVYLQHRQNDKKK